MDSLKSHTKQTVWVFILIFGSFSGYSQNGVERKQFFDYDWEFYR
ncbi:MAG TPA: hypothetical protein VK152_02330 [Paludibacter sp.]|nr:hypothetical protein [Paludibacter sp.]